LDFVLIDAEHISDAIVKDFSAAQACAAESCVYLFHDVMNFDMVEGLQRIVDESGLEGRLLTKTASGMAVVYDQPKVSQAFLDYVGVFADDMNIYEGYRNFASETQNGRNPFLMDPSE